MAPRKSLPIVFHDSGQEGQFQEIHFVTKGDNQIVMSNEIMKRQPYRSKQTNQDDLKVQAFDAISAHIGLKTGAQTRKLH